MVRAVTREVRELEKSASSILSDFRGSFDPSANPAAACSLLVDHLSMRRNKRCLLAYHRVRIEKLEEMSWNGEDVLDQELNPSDVQSKSEFSATDVGSTSSLSPEEEDYVRQFNDLLVAYKGQWSDIDLGGSLEPPKDLFIDVRVLKDAGEIQTEYG
jgi:GINS complex subunit 1